VSFYLVETTIRNVKLSDEHINFQWANYQAALARVTYKSSKDILILANKFLAYSSKSESKS
jgi:bis(5'-nucleosidyl)-tetraphosphatase